MEYDLWAILILKEKLKGGYFQKSEWKLLGKFIRESRVQKVAVKVLHKQTWFCSSTEMNEISQRQSYQEKNWVQL
jgi:hypothetical protein